MVIIGIDPGVARMGYGVIKKIRKRKRKTQDLRCLDFGCIETKKELEISKRFLILSREIRKLAKKYQPHLQDHQYPYLQIGLFSILCNQTFHGL